MSKVLVLNGPNLNLLGTRETHHYGAMTLEQILLNLGGVSSELGITLDHFQSNAEHDLIDRIQQSPKAGVDFILLNPAAFTHTSVGIRDALQAVGLPFIEIHLSNIHAREEFRQTSYFSDIAMGVISGLGPKGYELGLRAAADWLENQSGN